MKKQDYTATITVDTTPQEAFNSINNISGWWTKDIEGHSEKIDDIFTVRFGETFITIQLIKVIPHEEIGWKVIDCYKHWLKDKKEWLNTTMSWKISSADNTTKIEFTHHGLIPGIECYNGCENAWNFYVKESLFKLINKDKGTPELK